jgi:hypothetical protein
VLANLERDIAQSLDGTICVLTSTQFPKVYDEQVARKKGEHVSLVVRPPHTGILTGSDESCLKPLVDLSPALRTMSSLFLEEFRINLYIVKLDLRKSEAWNKEDLKSKIDNAILASLKNQTKNLIDRMGGIEEIMK